MRVVWSGHARGRLRDRLCNSDRDNVVPEHEMLRLGIPLPKNERFTFSWEGYKYVCVRTKTTVKVVTVIRIPSRKRIRKEKKRLRNSPISSGRRGNRLQAKRRTERLNKKFKERFDEYE